MSGHTVVVSVLADTQKFTKGFQKVGSGFKKLGIGAAAGLAVAGVALVKFGKEAVKSASKLEQASGAVDAVFKGQAAEVHSWAKSAAMDLGLAQSSYSEFAVLIGSQLKNMGIPMKDVTGQTKDLISKGADLAAQFGGSTSDAVSALSSLLRGETNPIERYGVSIKEADIKARMLADGTSKLEGEQFKLARTTAIMNLLSEQTADAMGANARESATWEGATGRLAALWENFKAKMGEPLIKVLSALLSKFNEFFAGILDSPALETLIGWLDGLADSILGTSGPAGGLIGDVASLMQAFSPFGILLKAIKPILPQLAEAFGHIGTTLADGLGAVLPTIMPVLDQLAVIVGELIASLLPPLVQVFDALVAAVLPLLPPLMELAGSILGVLADVLPILTPLFQTLADVIGKVLNAVVPIASSLLGALATLFDRLSPLLVVVAEMVMILVDAIAPLIVAIAELIGPILPPVIDLMVAILGPVLDAAAALGNILLPAIQWLADGLQLLTGPLTAVGDWFGSIFPQQADSGMTAAAATVDTNTASMLSTLEGSTGGFTAAGTSMMGGLGSGITAGGPKATGALGKQQTALGKEINKISNMPAPKAAGTKLTTDLGAGITTGQKKADTAIKKMGDSQKKAVTQLGRMPEAKKAGEQLATNIGKGVTTKAPSIKTAATKGVKDARASVAGQAGSFNSAGQSLISGLISGMESKRGAVQAKARSLADSANSAFKARQDIRSPSRVWRGFGEQLVAGLTVGVDRSKTAAVRSVQRLASSMNSGLEGGLEGAVLAAGGTVNQTYYQIGDATFTAATASEERVFEEFAALIRRKTKAGV